tara:strand:+ start:18168 stop:18431 length:264 start_codon:yes stop_codon:yes gene_type:complete
MFGFFNIKAMTNRMSQKIRKSKTPSNYSSSSSSKSKYSSLTSRLSNNTRRTYKKKNQGSRSQFKMPTKNAKGKNKKKQNKKKMQSGG